MVGVQAVLRVCLDRLATVSLGGVVVLDLALFLPPRFQKREVISSSLLAFKFGSKLLFGSHYFVFHLLQLVRFRSIVCIDHQRRRPQWRFFSVLVSSTCSIDFLCLNYNWPGNKISVNKNSVFSQLFEKVHDSYSGWCSDYRETSDFKNFGRNIK